MPTGLVDLAAEVISSLRSIEEPGELHGLMEAITLDFGCRHFGLIHHDDLTVPRAGLVDIKDYPSVVVADLYAQGRYRRGPVFRACAVAGQAFLWSELGQLLRLTRRDREVIALGSREGLNEGITIPYARLGDCLG
jgi:LuxR family quorum-sensing system transcriptional regulator CciR